MLKNFSLFIALRYLKPKRTYVSIITLISIVGVTLGVTVLIVVIAVMTGFEKKLEELILGFEPHVWVNQAGGMDMWDPERVDVRWDTVLEKVKKVPGVESAAPYMMGQILLQFGGDGNRRQTAMVMMGIREEDKERFESMSGLIKHGELDLSFDGCVVSTQFAEKNGIRIGQQLEVFSTGDLEGVVSGLFDAAEDDSLNDEQLRERVKDLTDRIQTPKDLRVTGLFDSMGYASDVMILPLFMAQELYDYDSNVHGLAVDVNRALEADLTQPAINAVLPRGWYSETWIQRHALRFATIRNERAMMYFVLFFIVLVAAFSTMNTMITVTVQKRHEIGVMKALGARVSQIVWVFLGQGMIVGLVGSLAGLGLGTVVLHHRNNMRAWLSERMGLDIFPGEMYGIAEIPAQIVAGDMLTICVGAFVLCALAALPPAYMVARLDPAKALRD